MAPLSFSEFVQILYPYCGNGATEAEFITTLTDFIMKGQPARETKEGKAQNPMRNKAIRTLQAYFKGERPISKRDASILFSSSDTYRFERFFEEQCSDTVLPLLKEKLEKVLNQEITNKKLVPFCADLFVRILHDCASGNIS